MHHTAHCAQHSNCNKIQIIVSFYESLTHTQLLNLFIAIHVVLRLVTYLVAVTLTYRIIYSLDAEKEL